METITYKVKNSLYVNMTNRCTSNCTFCIRSFGDGAYGSPSLWLDKEPTAEQIAKEVLSHDLSTFDELVFCGYGEPTMRIDELVYTAKKVKEVSDIRIRINTNGHANLYNKKDITPMLEGIIDVVSVSLNSAHKEQYDKVCRPAYKNAYEAMLEFTSLCSAHVKQVIMSVVRGTIPDEEIELCENIAKEHGATLRVREFDQ